jgi:integrase/recombinase XerD
MMRRRAAVRLIDQAAEVRPEFLGKRPTPLADEIERKWTEQTQAFDQYRKGQGKSLRTREIDQFELARLVAWATHTGAPLAEFGEDHATQFIVGQDGEITPRGVNMCIQSCCLFGDWLLSRGLWSANPFRQITRRREIKNRQPKGLTKEELGALLKAPDLKTANGLRDFLCMYLMAFVGLRVGEVVHLRASDVDTEACRLVVRGETAKTRVERGRV